MAEQEPSVAVDAESVRAHLEKVLACGAFTHAGRLSRLLRFAVEQVIAGRGDELKEYVIGVSVFAKGESFDPRIDPGVRVETHRLRAKLKRYYESEGKDDPVRIELPKGSYAPVFTRRPAPRRWARRKALAAAAALLVLAAGVYWAATQRDRPRSEPAGEISSIAVLPFANLSADEDQEIFCDGITEELINTLSKVEGLRVISRTSAFQFKGKASDVREVGRRLNVGAVLEGSVRKAGATLRITAQLVKAADGYHLWSGAYEREIKDVFAVQEEISRSIANALRVRLTRSLAESRTTDVEAYNFYLKGRYHWNKRTEEGLRRSIEYFEQSIARDRKWAVSHAALADSYALLASYGVVAPAEAMKKAKEAASEALRLDETMAQAHATLGFVRSFREWDWRAAEQEYKRAIELNPGYATARQWYAGCLRAVGRTDEALAEMKRAQELDPLSLAAGRDLGRVFLSMRQYERAVEQYRKVLELEPNFPSAYMHLGMAYEEMRMHREAVEALEKARSLPGASPLVLGALGRAYAVSGRRGEAERLLGELESLSRRRHVSPVSRAFISIGLDDKDRALEWLERACAEHDPWIAWLKADPVFDTLRADPRFQRLLRKVGLAL